MDDRKPHIELGESEFANKLEIIANAAASKVIPFYAKIVIILLAVTNLIGLPAVAIIINRAASNCDIGILEVK